MNKSRKRFGVLFPAALLVATQLQPAFAGFRFGRFQTASSSSDLTNIGKVDATGIQPPPTVLPKQPTTREREELAASGNEKPAPDLTGTWVYERIGSQCTVNKCTLATFSLPSLTVNGQTGKVTGEIKITQRGNQISIPDRKYVWNGGKYTFRYDGGKISGNKVTLTETAVDTSVGWGYTNSYTGTVSADGNTVEGEVVYKPSTGNNTAKTTFIWRKKVPLAQCPRFKTMLSEAKELQKIADTLEKDDKAYHTAAIDIILRGYRSPYAVYMLDIPSKEIPKFFRDEEQIRAVRSQIISRIRTKASNREEFANIGINGNFKLGDPVRSKENIELFCTLDSSKFTKEFWDSLWMAGYIDYDLYKETETKIIIVSHKDYFENLAEVATSLLVPIEKPFLFIAGYVSKAFKGFSLTKLGIKNIQALKAKELPRAAIEEIGLFSKAEAAANTMAALSRATLPAGESFATIIHIGALTEKIGIVSAEKANAEIVRKLGGKPPFLEGTNVTRYKVGEKGLNLVRFWGGDLEMGGSKEIGYYLTFESEVIEARSDAVALRDALALPSGNTMEHVSVIKVKPGAEIEVGKVGDNFGSDGGGIQVRVMNDNLEKFTTVLKRIQ